jgi:hypothetical protein
VAVPPFKDCCALAGAAQRAVAAIETPAANASPRSVPPDKALEAGTLVRRSRIRWKSNI